MEKDMKRITSTIAILMITTQALFGACLTCLTKKYNYTNGYPVLELWNKYSMPIYYHITQNISDFNSAGITPATLANQSRVSAWNVGEKQRKQTDKPTAALKSVFSLDKHTYIGLYPTSAARQQPYEVFRVPPNRTIYLSWADSNVGQRLYPQTGPCKGLSSVTESCLDRKNNIKESELQDVTAQTPAAGQKKQEQARKTAQEKKQAEDKQKKGLDYLEGKGSCVEIFDYLAALSEEFGKSKQFALEKDIERGSANFLKVCVEPKEASYCSQNLPALLNQYSVRGSAQKFLADSRAGGFYEPASIKLRYERADDKIKQQNPLFIAHCMKKQTLQGSIGHKK